MIHRKYLAFLVAILMASSSTAQVETVGKLRISADGRYFIKENGEPFFWLGDTGWLLFAKLNREEALKYLEDRQQKGFNVIQVSLIHGVSAVNAYGDTALIKRNVATPKITEGNSFSDSVQYDFWDHIDFIIDEAAKRGIYMGLVPVWGGNVKSGLVNTEKAKIYAGWIADRYKNKPNIIWINGGDIKGSDSLNVWKTIGQTLNEKDPNHLITFHPRGRTTSSSWFHNADWLDFNMFQSGHRNYAQDTSMSEPHRFGEDNWRFINLDYSKKPVKPTLDGEPSYEQIPYGLHDTTLPYWQDRDVRRYGYWSVFAGGSGYTYGHNSIMQFHKPTDKGKAFGSRFYWFDAINHPGAGQMKHLKNLLLSRPYFERVPDQSMIAGKQGIKYDYLLATRGKNYAFIYAYTGKNFKVNMGKIGGTSVKATWYSPVDGSTKEIGAFSNKGVTAFNPPGEPKEGNDWVLILDKV